MADIIDDNIENESPFEALNDCLNDFWLKNESLNEKCIQLLSKVNRHKYGCNVAKSVGAGVSGVGSAAIIAGIALTPFTGGLSTVVAIGGGVTSGVGALTSIGTHIADVVITKSFTKELLRLSEDRDRSAVIVSQRLQEFDIVWANDNIADDNRLDNGLNGLKIFRHLANGSVSAYKVMDNSVKMVESLKELKALKVAQNVKSNTAFIKSVSKGVVSLAPTEANGLSSAVVKSAGASGGKLLLNGAAAAVGLVFTVIEVADIVRKWSQSHSTVDAINDVIHVLQNDQNMIETINALINNMIETNA